MFKEVDCKISGVLFQDHGERPAAIEQVRLTTRGSFGFSLKSK